MRLIMTCQRWKIPAVKNFWEFSSFPPPLQGFYNTGVVSGFCTQGAPNHHSGGVRGGQHSLFSAHCRELRQRGIYFLFSFSVTFLTGTYYSSPLTHLICAPFSSGREKESCLFIFTHLTEGLYAALDVSFMYTLCFSAPFLFYQVYCFLMPSCYQGERSTINRFLLFAAVLFFLSFYTAFFFLLPKICIFFQQFQYESKCLEIKLEARIAPAVRWCGTAFFSTALFFQTPVMLAVLLNWGVVRQQFLGEKRRYVFFCLLLISSFFSPPDVSSQCAFSLGGCVFYELFLWCALFHHRWIKTQVPLPPGRGPRLVGGAKPKW